MGFPVTDLGVTLVSGETHAVDRSEMAFRPAGRLAIQDGLAPATRCCWSRSTPVKISPCLEHFHRRAHGRAGGGRSWGSAPERTGVAGSEDRGLSAAKRAAGPDRRNPRAEAQGLGAFEADFDHMAELTGRTADKVIQSRAAEAGAVALRIACLRRGRAGARVTRAEGGRPPGFAPGRDTPPLSICGE